MKEEVFIEVGHSQKCKHGNPVCGDSFMSRKTEDGRIICVLSDGLGSGIKACVLSTMTATMAMNYVAMNETVLRTAMSVINTLPMDMERGISYSTFCIPNIDCFGNTKIIEYETPAFHLFRNGNTIKIDKKQIPVERDDLTGTFLWISEFQLQKEDRLVFFTDGVTQSGMGTSQMPSGWEQGIEQYITGIIEQNPRISAKDLAQKVVSRAERNDGYVSRDDTTCCVIYRRIPRNLLICTGPPYDEKKDRYLAERVKSFPGKKILCGGTTTAIVSRELQIPIQTDKQDCDTGLPPISVMEGIDLVTEGMLTLSKVERILVHPPTDKHNERNAATKLVQMIQDSDKISFIVGTRINVAHQDPNLPVELDIRRNVVKKIKYLLEEKYLKDVEIIYI